MAYITDIEFACALKIIGWSKRELARRLECHPVMVQRWADGVASVPDEVAFWLKHLAQHHSINPAPEWRAKTRHLRDPLW